MQWRCVSSERSRDVVGYGLVSLFVVMTAFVRTQIWVVREACEGESEIWRLVSCQNSAFQDGR